MYNEYPYTDFHELNLDWFLAEFKQVHDHVDDLDATVTEFTQFVTIYFDNLDVQEEINNKLDALVADGTIADLLLPLTTEAVGDWLEEHITPTTPPVDDTLTIAGAAADSKTVGDKFSNLEEHFDYSNDVLINSMGYRYVDYEQGTLGSSGEEISNSSWVRTSDYIPIENLLFIDKPVGVQITVYFYDENKNYITNYSGSYSIVATDYYTTLRTAQPSAKYIKIRVRLYSDSTALDTTPAMVVSSGLNLILSIDASNTLEEYGIELTETKDKINDLLGYEYTDYEQGTLDSIGEEVSNANWSRTSDYIPVESIIAIYKPVGVQITLYFYTNEYNYISNLNAGNAAIYTTTGEIIKTYSPTCEYVKMRIRVYEGSTAQATTPSMVLASGFKITTAENVNTIVTNGLNKGYLNLEEETLTGRNEYIINYSSNKHSNMIFTIRSKYTGTQPVIVFVRSWEDINGNLHEYYQSANFPIGDTDYITQQFRVPKYFESSGDLKVIIAVPDNSSLDIAYLYNSYSESFNSPDYGINLNAHGKCASGAPENTMASFICAHDMGYKYCITIPKVTSDGVLVCLHDDESIQSTARNDDGTTIDAAYQNRPVSDFTYSQLLQFDFGVIRGKPFAGERIPTLEDFFKLCAKTGMHPMLSCHPSLSGYWNDIKALAVKYNLLDKLNIKCDQSNITVMMDVLGDDIESYTIDESDGVDRTSRMAALIARYSIDTTKCRCGVEYVTTINDSLIESALNAGLFVGYAGYGTDAATVKSLIAKGVTEFTDDYIGSVGLNW